MIDWIYIPNLKTSDSELRAVKNLGSEIKSQILPAFELTRSRATKKMPHGSVMRRAEQLLEIYGDNPFVLDLTTENDLLNSEMETFFDEQNGYAAWRNFVEKQFAANVVPALQYVEGGTEDNFKTQAIEFLKRHRYVALRVSVSDLESSQLYVWLAEIADLDRIIVIGNLYFLEQTGEDIYFDRCRRFITDVIGNRIPSAIAFPGSSFPKAVGSNPYGNDDQGTFAAKELTLSQRLFAQYPNLPIVYSDYASVHPIRYPTKGGGWIPRIDVIQSGDFTFSRLRRESGGYGTAARNIVAKFKDTLTPSWGAEQIYQAAKGNVPGGSPSYWISARINMWITQRVRDLQGS